MISNDSDVFRIYQEEAAEYVYELHRSLLSLRSNGGRDEAVVRQAARNADGLLGASVTVGKDAIGHHARKLRDDVTELRDGAMDEKTAEMLFASLDTIAELLDAELLDKAVSQEGPGFQRALAARSAAHELHRALIDLERTPTPPRDITPLTMSFRNRCAETGLPELARLAEHTVDVLHSLEAHSSANGDLIGLVHQGLGFVAVLESARVAEIRPVFAELSEMLQEGIRKAPAAPSPTVIPRKVEIPRKDRVLIASNSGLFLKPLLEALEERNHEVLRAADADELRAHLESRTVALCFLRDSLPQGLETWEKLSRESDVPPLVVYSPLARVERLAAEKGAAGFLKVPCQARQVRALLEQHVDAPHHTSAGDGER